MNARIHFVSGLPRSGSTLLAALLRQNPRIHANMSSPVSSLVSALQRQMSQENESAVFIDDEQREAILRGVFAGYYRKAGPDEVVLDTSRMWCSKMPLLRRLLPAAKVIACVRHVPWIVDSLERLARTNSLEPSKIYNFDASGTVYSRVEALGAGNGLIGYAWNGLREAFYGEEADSLMLLQYETLTTDPARAMAAVYDFLGEPPFAHDFEDIRFDAGEFDARLGAPGLHRVGRRVEARSRDTVLPPDLFRRVEADTFWRDPAANLRQVRIV